MSVVNHNRLMKRSNFEDTLEEFFDIISYESLGLYLVLSRVFQPAYVHPSQPSHTHDINKIASQLQNMIGEKDALRKFDYAGVYVMRKKINASFEGCL